MFSAPSGAGPRRAAFTLLELLAVISIIALLAAIVIGVGRRATETGRTARARTELAALAAALEDYRRAFGDYPQTDDGAQLLQALSGRRGPHDTAIAARSLLEISRFKTTDSRDPFTDSTAVLIDPWDRAYRYLYKVPVAGWTNSSYVLYSSGPDGQASPTLLTGGFPDDTAAGNADNLHANRF